MEILAEILDSRPKPTEPEQPLPEQRNREVTPLSDPLAKQALATMVYQCFQSQKLYGKEPEALESTVAMFQLVLAEYPLPKIQEAFRFYLKHHSEMPAPADIANIIERGIKPPLDRAVYVAISKKVPEFRTPEEWEYLREFEAMAVRGHLG